ncbi:AAA family ATPase, partial [Henriciella aquimarina]|uniref:AAA family ATPase n=1 Tax=Henriciella aquimarina TaxID=545261 RepID=UPI000A06845C
MDMTELQALAEKIRGEVAKAVIGQRETVDLMLTALFSAGHILLEGPPGTAKTLLTQSFAAAIDLDFGRIQFTPDLMPGDVLGTNLFNFQTNEFSLTKGPIFTDILLADEINRTPPKTQAALLEAMQERKVTIDGKPHSLNDRFMVIATQNPIEQQGTYPLPEAQLDRFLFKHVLDYPSREEEVSIVAGHGSRTGMKTARAFGVTAAVNSDDLAKAVETVSNVKLKEDVVGYIV